MINSPVSVINVLPSILLVPNKTVLLPLIHDPSTNSYNPVFHLSSPLPSMTPFTIPNMVCSLLFLSITLSHICNSDISIKPLFVFTFVFPIIGIFADICNPFFHFE